MVYEYFFLSLIFLINCAIKDNKYMIFNFRTNINLAEVNDENYMSKKLDQKIYVDLDIGEPAQKIPMTISTWQFPTYVISKDVTDNIKVKFDYQKSDTYTKAFDFLIENIPKYDFSKGFYSKDTLGISPALKYFYFMLATENGIGSKNISGEIGLAKNNPQKDYPYNYPGMTNFIQQLLDNNLIDKKFFGIIYDTEYEGKLIFGDYGDDIEKNYEIKETNEFSLDYAETWLLNFDLNCLGGEDKTLLYEQKDTFGYFRIEYGLMIGSTTFRDNFVRDYFINKGCQNTTVYASFALTVYYCTDKSQFDDFPEITFKKSGKFNFTFTKDELFVQRGNKYIFQIVFEIFADDGVTFWKLGQTFFRKYGIFLKEEDRYYKLAYYMAQSKDNSDDRKGISSQVIIIIVLSIILAILITGIVIYFVYFYPKRRKKRAQELNDDDFEYTPNKEPKDQLLADDAND